MLAAIYRCAVHLADRLHVPSPYVARPYRGPSDHAAIAEVLGAYRRAHRDSEMPTVAQIDLTYANLRDCDPDLDIAVVERDGQVVGYTRASFEDLDSGTRDCVVFAPVVPEHLTLELWTAIVDANEEHMVRWALEVDRAQYRAYADHPGPQRDPAGEAAWLESRGYVATEWAASLVRPHLDDIPDRSLPDGVELREVQPEQLRAIFDAHWEAFRDEWDFREQADADWVEFVEHPYRDTTLWKVAWAGDDVVGQVKSYVNHEENSIRGVLRGYTEDISTHRDWRNRGIAGTLLAWSLQELRERGMTEAALGVDTNNPGGAFQLYTSLGFELVAYEAVYTKPIP
jgi:ribosomal protein S18 acetylase RimI-like enzyme